MYKFNLLINILKVGVMIMFSLHGAVAQRHISFSIRIPFFTGTRMTRMPAALTSFAALRAFQRFEALPSVMSKTTCCRFFVDPTWNMDFAPRAVDESLALRALRLDETRARESDV